VDEEFQTHDPRSTARLKSISGFAFVPGDSFMTSRDGTAIGILHGGRLVTLRWHRADLERIETRRTRGAEIVTLVFSRRLVEMRLGLYSAANRAQARRFLEGSPP
jgi:hypothetical protein